MAANKMPPQPTRPAAPIPAPPGMGNPAMPPMMSEQAQAVHAGAQLVNSKVREVINMTAEMAKKRQGK